MKYKYQMFNGIRFREESPGGYYINNSHITDKPNIRMHRYVWQYYNGPIPDGYCVHHIDGNKGNNSIDNLQLMREREHLIHHSNTLTDSQIERRRLNMLTTVHEAAKKWHKSEAGSVWHSNNAKQMHKTGAFTRELMCTECGKLYMGELHKTGGNTFCSNICKSKHLRKVRATDVSDDRICSICGKEFSCSKWSTTTTCSRSCRNKLRWRNIKHNEG